MNTFHLRVATPDGAAYAGEAEMLAVRGIDGDLAILAGHIPFITAVQAGVCRIITAEGEKAAEISGGMLCVGKDQTTLLADSIRWTKE